MRCTVVVEGALVLVRSEADLAGVMLFPHVALELEEGGDVRPPANSACKSRSGSCSSGRATTHVRYQGAIVQEVVLANVASKYFSFVSNCCVGLQRLVGFALAG